jgi:hypothetical protein
MRRNLELSRELDKAKEEAENAKAEAEFANTAFRKLAEWSYNERLRLLDEIPRRKTQIIDLDAEWLKCTLKTLTEQQQAKAVKNNESEEGGNINMIQDDLSDIEEVPSITDQVDQLIAEERAKLTAL